MGHLAPFFFVSDLIVVFFGNKSIGLSGNSYPDAMIVYSIFEQTFWNQWSAGLNENKQFQPIRVYKVEWTYIENSGIKISIRTLMAGNLNHLNKWITFAGEKD